MPDDGLNQTVVSCLICLHHMSDKILLLECFHKLLTPEPRFVTYQNSRDTRLRT